VQTAVKISRYGRTLMIVHSGGSEKPIRVTG
jgi:hypothetical protein